MLSIARSLAMVASQNRMVYQFGPDHDFFLWLGGGSTLGIPNPVIVLARLLAWRSDSRCAGRAGARGSWPSAATSGRRS